MSRRLVPPNTAQAVVWLCAPQSVYLTGVTLPVDGGYRAGMRPGG